MNFKNSACVICIALITPALYGQDKPLKLKITDMDDRVITLTHVTTSSSSLSDSADFPVYRGETKTGVRFEDLQFIFVRRDKPPADDRNFLTVELVKEDGTSDLCKIIKHIRFLGRTEEGNFSIPISNVSSVRIMKSPY